MIVGLGTDIVDILRIGRMIERHGELFLRRVFTEGEIRYCQRRRECDQHYAGRWAAKEAVMKTLGTGWTRGVGWQDIEVTSSKSGQPKIEIHVTGANLESVASPPPAAILRVLNLPLQITDHTRLVAVASPGSTPQGNVEFESRIAAVNVNASTFTLGNGTVIDVAGATFDPLGDLLRCRTLLA